jgi:hypothetical protein
MHLAKSRQYMTNLISYIIMRWSVWIKLIELKRILKSIVDALYPGFTIIYRITCQLFSNLMEVFLYDVNTLFIE